MIEIQGFRQSLQQAKEKSYAAGNRVARGMQREDLMLSGSERTAKAAIHLLGEVWMESLMSGHLTEQLESELQRRGNLVYNSPTQRSARAKINELVQLFENA
jgi:hypothetical protein